MVYASWLWGFALLFVVAERLWPRVARPWWRRGLATDLGYLIFNSEYLGVALGWVSAHLFASLQLDWLGAGVLAGWPVWGQLAAILVGFDLARW